LYSNTGRPSIAPEKLLRALPAQVLYSVAKASDADDEQLDYNMLFRWFVGLSMDDDVWDATTFTKNRERLLKGILPKSFSHDCLSDGGLRPAPAMNTSQWTGPLYEGGGRTEEFQEGRRPDKDPPDDPGNPTVNFHGEKRSPDASIGRPIRRAAEKKGKGKEANAHYGRACCIWENRNGLGDRDASVTRATGTAERDSGIEFARKWAAAGSDDGRR